MNPEDWINNPLLKDIDPVKLQIITTLANEGTQKSKTEMLPFFMSAMSQANQKGVAFTPEERQLMLDILMQNLSPEEKKRAETIVKMTSAFQK